MNEEIKNEIQKLKKEKDAVILAHYYVDGEVQEIADYVGDSYYLAEIATKVPESTIVFCGVSFMGESAKTALQNACKNINFFKIVLLHTLSILSRFENFFNLNCLNYIIIDL